jgi:hypothetical protein
MNEHVDLTGSCHLHEFDIDCFASRTGVDIF